MIKNLVEEIISRSVGKNWSIQFVQRHKKLLTNYYLKNIKKKYQDAEYVPMFKQFFNLVIDFYGFLYVL